MSTRHAEELDGPPGIRQLAPTELEAMLDSGSPPVLVDVRTPEERALARIDGSRLFDREGHDYVLSLERDTPIACYCHHGIRSQAAAEYLRQHGFRTLYNLRGGIDQWSIHVDPSVPRY